MTTFTRPSASLLSRRLALPAVLALGALLLSGCGAGQPGTFGKVLQPGWIEADFDGNGTKDLIAETNLADVVFNPEGEITGWFVKVNPGSQLIKRNADGTFNFDQLNGNLVLNLVGGRNGPDNKPLLASGRKGLEVVIDGNTAAKTPQAPQTGTDVKDNRLSATFTYTQGAATVTKTVLLHPRQFSVQTNINVTGASNYAVNFPGLGRESNPVVKVQPQGASAPTLGPSSSPSAVYAALQSPLGTIHNSQTSAALLIRPQQGGQGALPTQGPLSVTTLGGADASLSVKASGPLALDVYGGKNELIHLYQEGYTAQPGVFNPNIFGQISLLIAKLMTWLYSFLGNWGLTILVLTVVLRLLIWPLMQSQGRTTAKMQMVQPLMKELQDKHKDDPAKLQAETMRLYREHEVNPAGCLSMFIPLPILFVLYGTIRNFEFDSGLWWLPDLSIPDPFWILGILYVCANLLQLYVSTRKTPQMFKQQSVLYLFFAYFALTFPAGVTLYWIISTLIGAGQQFLINKQVEAHMAGGLQRVEKMQVATPTGSAKKVSTVKTVDVESKSAKSEKPGFRAMLEKATQQAAEQQKKKPE